MHPKYKKGQKVQIYHPNLVKYGVVEEIKLSSSGKTWLYLLSDPRCHPETKKINMVTFGNGGWKYDWEEERWLRSC